MKGRLFQEEMKGFKRKRWVWGTEGGLRGAGAGREKDLTGSSSC
jgi:hypothetical protein